MTATGLHFVLSDRVADFDACCAAAGFDLHGARRFSALYSGLRCSERRVARALAERLWLPLAFEPMLSGSRLGLDDEPEPESARAHPLAARHPAGAAALALAQRHRAARIVFALHSELVTVIAAELARLLPDRVALAAGTDPAVAVLELELPDPAHHERFAVVHWQSGDAEVRALDAYLRALGADRIEHPGGVLLDHLRRTAERLASWRARPALIAAGMCHAAYGTAGFAPALLALDQRTQLAERIGCEAEAIVYAYAASERTSSGIAPTPAWASQRDRFTGQTVPLTSQRARDLAELACANELDVLRSTQLDGAQRAAITAMLAQLQPRVGYRAASAVAEALHAQPAPALERAP